MNLWKWVESERLMPLGGSAFDTVVGHEVQGDMVAGYLYLDNLDRGQFLKRQGFLLTERAILVIDVELAMDSDKRVTEANVSVQNYPIAHIASLRRLSKFTFNPEWSRDPETYDFSVEITFTSASGLQTLCVPRPPGDRPKEAYQRFCHELTQRLGE